MKAALRFAGLSLIAVVAACGGHAPPAVAPARTDPPPIAKASMRTAEESCMSAGGGAECLNVAPNPARRDSAARALQRGFISLTSAGIKQFAADHPQWDGRGVLIAVMDSGIDPGIPGLGTTSDGAQKILDLRDFSGEGRIPLQRVTRRGDTLLVGSRQLLGASRLLALAGDTPVWGGSIAELALGRAPSADINGNGRVGDTLVVIVAKSSAGWALLTDTNGDGTLADEKPVYDYLVAHDVFGWHSRTSGAPVHLAANITDSAGVPAVDLFFDTSSHGSHVTGIAAGHDIYGVPGFDGVAPGARVIGLKIANDAHGAVSVSGSMVRALEYAIRFASDRSMPLVVNLSFGVGNELEGSARIDAMIDSVLAVHPDVVMTVAAGNDGPGLSTLGFPGSASRVISVGATLPLVFASLPTDGQLAEPVAPFSSRGGELSGPDIVVPGEAYSTVPNYAMGDELENGTSMASPYAAGLAARLLSAAKGSGTVANARQVRQALRVGAHRLPSSTTLDQGAGLPDLSQAWKWLSASHDFNALAVDVGPVVGRGAVFLTASPVGATVRPLGARVGLRRFEGTAPLTVRLLPDVIWLQIPETVTLVAGKGEFTVAVQPAAIGAPGLVHATIRVEGPDETAGPLAVIPVTVRIPVPAAGTRVPLEFHLAPGATGRTFVPADTGRGMQIEVATLREQDRVAAALHEPGGMPFRDDRTMAAGFGSGAGMFDIDARDVTAGLYELDVEGNFATPSDAKVTIRAAPVRLGATMVHDTLRVSARSLVAAPLSVRLRAGLIGGERIYTINAAASAPVRVAIPVPSWAGRTVVDSWMPREAWSRFTDFGLSFLDRHGRLFDSTPINYAFSRATPTLPDSIVGDTLIMLLSPALADTADHGAWTLNLTVRFYVDKPYSLDAGGSPARVLAAAGLREERFVPGALQIDFPDGFMPLVTIVALEGSEHIWTREVTPGRMAGVRK